MAQLWTCGLLACEIYNQTCFLIVKVITYILLCGYPPFYAELLPELLEKIQNFQYSFIADDWTDISREAKDFVRRLLVHCSNRMTAEQALEVYQALFTIVRYV